METTDHQLHILDVQPETPNVKSLYLEKPAGFSFIAGQYLTIKLPNLGPVEGKAYSISSAPHEEHLRITIKDMGRFSSALLTLQEGDIVTTSSPYGFFYPEPADPTPLVFVIGGIGITPALSIMKDLVHKDDQRSVRLLYSNRTEADIVFRGELEELSAQTPRLTIHHFITREAPESTGFHAGRMTASHFRELLPSFDQAEYFLCGNMDFTKSLWKDLHTLGLLQHQIYTEG
ncbi:hypothetical protein KC906_03025, partial [Candidatus Kaiserbacteria bacterium]|nr:hypothetical protein [Candidatus Kaiserbacteria bacterium]